MIRTTIVVTALATIFTLSGIAQPVPLSVVKGSFDIARGGSGERMPVTGTVTVDSTDQLSISDDREAVLSVNGAAALLVRGPAGLSLFESNAVLTIEVDSGQVLFDHKNSAALTKVIILAKGYSFEPVGTAAAVKVTKDSPPTMAVVEGSVRMLSPSGEALVIDQGSFGSVLANGTLSAGALSARAVESLRNWLSTAPGRDVPASVNDEVPTSGERGIPSASSPEMTTGQTSDGSEQNEVSADVSTPVKPSETTTPAPDNVQSSPPGDAVAATAGQQQEPAGQDAGKAASSARAPMWEIGAGTATVNNEQWTRLAVGIDVPIWKFGIFFDVELFIDSDGRFSDKGWNFGDDPVDALSRKIRYIRFGQEGEPLFIKVGGLSSVSLGYGFLVDRLSNMLRYPDERQLGLQVELNNISPVGITLQGIVADFKEFRDDGGVVGARMALRPFKMTGIPIVNGVTFGGSYAADLNQYAPARNWKIREPVSVKKLNVLLTIPGWDSSRAIDTITNAWGEPNPRYENESYRREQHAAQATDQFGLIGADVGIPIITSQLLNLELYGQAGLRDDRKHGWGIGAPGVSLKVWRLWASLEYRHVEGAFQPGYFGTYYLDERLFRVPTVVTKEQRLVSDTLNGVFGRLGFDVGGILLVEGNYQYMIGKHEDHTDQRFEAIGSLGKVILDRIPKLNRAEVYFYKSRIGTMNDGFFEKTPSMYFGYRVGFEIAAGASLIWDARHGYAYDAEGNLGSDNNISVQTALSF